MKIKSIIETTKCMYAVSNDVDTISVSAGMEKYRQRIYKSTTSKHFWRGR